MSSAGLSISTMAEAPGVWVEVAQFEGKLEARERGGRARSRKGDGLAGCNAGCWQGLVRIGVCLRSCRVSARPNHSSGCCSHCECATSWSRESQAQTALVRAACANDAGHRATMLWPDMTRTRRRRKVAFAVVVMVVACVAVLPTQQCCPPALSLFSLSLSLSLSLCYNGR
jgi:hypothetical protein